MGLRKGMTNNRNGRPVGSGNSVIAAVRNAARDRFNSDGVVHEMFDNLKALKEKNDIIRYNQMAKDLYDMFFPKPAPDAPDEDESKKIESIFETYFEKMSKKAV